MKRKSFHEQLMRRLSEPRRFIQVVAGPRQVGKTTLVLGVVKELALPSHYASADEPGLKGNSWIEQQWERVRQMARENAKGAVLVLDEVQKIPQWSEVVKFLWDTDTREKCPLQVVLLGSSPLLIQSGLSESLAGRFELVRIPHWSWPEIREAFGWTLEQYLYFGAYPGSASLVGEVQRWRNYVLDSLVETTISRDILLMSRVDKPALLRQMFQLSCDYSGQILSYQKMLGQLAGAGNTVTLAHYLDLLAGVGMVAGLQKFSRGPTSRRGSSPKLQVLNTALMTVQSPYSLPELRQNPGAWGRVVESAVGAHLLNTAQGTEVEVFYWRDRNAEVDFVLQRGTEIVAIEVKSGRAKDVIPGMEAFGREYQSVRKLLVGGQGIELDEFLSEPAIRWFK